MGQRSQCIEPWNYPFVICCDFFCGSGMALWIYTVKYNLQVATTEQYNKTDRDSAWKWNLSKLTFSAVSQNPSSLRLWSAFINNRYKKLLFYTEDTVYCPPNPNSWMACNWVGYVLEAEPLIKLYWMTFPWLSLHRWGISIPVRDKWSSCESSEHTSLVYF